MRAGKLRLRSGPAAEGSARDIPGNSGQIPTPTVTNQFACLTPLTRTLTRCRVQRQAYPHPLQYVSVILPGLFACDVSRVIPLPCRTRALG